MTVPTFLRAKNCLPFYLDPGDVVASRRRHGRRKTLYAGNARQGDRILCATEHIKPRAWGRFTTWESVTVQGTFGGVPIVGVPTLGDAPPGHPVEDRRHAAQ